MQSHTSRGMASIEACSAARKPAIVRSSDRVPCADPTWLLVALTKPGLLYMRTVLHCRPAPARRLRSCSCRLSSMLESLLQRVSSAPSASVPISGPENTSGLTEGRDPAEIRTTAQPRCAHDQSMPCHNSSVLRQLQPTD